MQGFDWAENNLDVETPQALQQRGVNVFFAPNISPGAKVINLADGTVQIFMEGADRPHQGYFADNESLVRFCLHNGIPFTGTGGQASVLSAGHTGAGDPLQRGRN